MAYLKKVCMFPVGLVNNCRFLEGKQTECLKIGLNHTEFLCTSSPWPTNCADLLTAS